MIAKIVPGVADGAGNKPEQSRDDEQLDCQDDPTARARRVHGRRGLGHGGVSREAGQGSKRSERQRSGRTIGPSRSAARTRFQAGTPLLCHRFGIVASGLTPVALHAACILLPLNESLEVRDVLLLGLDNDPKFRNLCLNKSPALQEQFVEPAPQSEGDQTRAI